MNLLALYVRAWCWMFLRASTKPYNYIVLAAAHAQVILIGQNIGQSESLLLAGVQRYFHHHGTYAK